MTWVHPSERFLFINNNEIVSGMGGQRYVKQAEFCGLIEG